MLPPYTHEQLCGLDCPTSPPEPAGMQEDATGVNLTKMLTGLVRTPFTTAIHQDISFRFSPIAFAPDLWCFTTSLEALP